MPPEYGAREVRMWIPKKLRRARPAISVALALALMSCSSSSNGANARDDAADHELGEPSEEETSSSRDDRRPDARVTDAQPLDAASGAPARDSATPSDAFARSPDAAASDASAAETLQQPIAHDAGTATSSGIGCMDAIAPTARNIEALLQRSCGLAQSCHAGDRPQAGLDLSTLDGLFATVVGKSSSQVETLTLITPYAPEESYLMQKVKGGEIEGMKMPPPPATALCEARVQALERWIRAGALR